MTTLLSIQVWPSRERQPSPTLRSMTTRATLKTKAEDTGNGWKREGEKQKERILCNRQVWVQDHLIKWVNRANRLELMMKLKGRFQKVWVCLIWLWDGRLKLRSKTISTRQMIMSKTIWPKIISSLTSKELSNKTTPNMLRMYKPFWSTLHGTVQIRCSTTKWLVLKLTANPIKRLLNREFQLKIFARASKFPTVWWKMVSCSSGLRRKSYLKSSNT